MQLNDENISGFEGGGQLKYSLPHSHYSNAEPLSRKDFIQKRRQSTQFLFVLCSL